MMALTEDMFVTTCQAVLGCNQATYGDETLDFTPPWRRVSVTEALREYAGFRLTPETTREELLDVVRSHDIAVEPDATRPKLLDELVSSLVEPKLIQPTFLIDFPIHFPGGLFAKRKIDEPEIVERFELYVRGMEIANAFTELNDPRDQLERMEEATRLSGEEHQELDKDFLLALEYGMPPTGGLGFGIERLVMLLTGAQHIRETILFPLLRPREDAHAEP